MTDTTKLEGIFQDIKDSVDRLEGRVGGVEHRIAVISHDLEKECSKDNVLLEVPMSYILWFHTVLGITIVILGFRIIRCVLFGGGL